MTSEGSALRMFRLRIATAALEARESKPPTDPAVLRIVLRAKEGAGGDSVG